MGRRGAVLSVKAVRLKIRYPAVWRSAWGYLFGWAEEPPQVHPGRFLLGCLVLWLLLVGLFAL